MRSDCDQHFHPVFMLTGGSQSGRTQVMEIIKILAYFCRFFAAMDHRSNGCIRDGLLRLSSSSSSVVRHPSSVTPFSGLSSYPRLIPFGYVIRKLNGLSKLFSAGQKVNGRGR